jgi:RNA polymerase sigma-70 factor (ECF subfamily)
VSTAEVRAVDPVEEMFAAGDDTALRSAYDAHGSLIYSFCRRTLDDERAKDVTQEVFVSAWRSRHRFDASRGTLAGWLTAIAKNRIIDNVRSEARHSTSSVEPGELATPHDTPHDVDRIGDRMLVADALTALPERSRTVIELAYFGDLTHVQVAEQLGLPLGTVKSDIRRGLTSIRHHLETSHD